MKKYIITIIDTTTKEQVVFVRDSNNYAKLLENQIPFYKPTTKCTIDRNLDNNTPYQYYESGYSNEDGILKFYTIIAYIPTKNVNRNTLINTKVKVIKVDNASDFNDLSMPKSGVYSLDNWKDIEFTISGRYIPYTVGHSGNIYGVYPLMYNNKIYGYVYNHVLELV